MQKTWVVTKAERDRVVRDAFRSQMTSEAALILYGLDLAILAFEGVVGGWVMALVTLVVIVVALGILALIWHRQISQGMATAYPDGSTASAAVVGDRLRLETAIGVGEVGLRHFTKPRVTGSVLTVIKPGARWRRVSYPLALVPDEALAAMRR